MVRPSGGCPPTASPRPHGGERQGRPGTPGTSAKNSSLKRPFSLSVRLSGIAGHDKDVVERTNLAWQPMVEFQWRSYPLPWPSVRENFSNLCALGSLKRFRVLWRESSSGERGGRCPVGRDAGGGKSLSHSGGSSSSQCGKEPVAVEKLDGIGPARYGELSQTTRCVVRPFR